MDNLNIIINYCLGCVIKWLLLIQEPLLNCIIRVMSTFNNSLLLMQCQSKGLHRGVDLSLLLTHPI